MNEQRPSNQSAYLEWRQRDDPHQDQPWALYLVAGGNDAWHLLNAPAPLELRGAAHEPPASLGGLVSEMRAQGYHDWATRVERACPPPAETRESGWLVENGKIDAKYRYFDETGLVGWTSDARRAIRFARRVDAEQFAAADEDAWAIVEHVFVSTPETKSEPCQHDLLAPNPTTEVDPADPFHATCRVCKQEWCTRLATETLSKRLRDAGFKSRRQPAIPPDDEPADETSNAPSVYTAYKICKDCGYLHGAHRAECPAITGGPTS